MTAASRNAALRAALDGFVPMDAQEAADLARVRELLAAGDPWPRNLPLHVTGSAVIVDPRTRRVLLRWHARQGAWLQVGGHADPGEHDPFHVALREGREETGLTDLRPWPTAQPTVLQVCIVPVPPGKGEPAHEHADVRFALATAMAESARPENDGAAIEWLSLDQALVRAADENLRVALRRVGLLFEQVDPTKG